MKYKITLFFFVIFFFEACLVSMLIESPKTLTFPKDFYGHSKFTLIYKGNPREIRLKYLCQYKYFWSGIRGWDYKGVAKPERFSFEIEKNHYLLISNPFCADQKMHPEILVLSRNGSEITDVRSIEEKTQPLKNATDHPIQNFASGRFSKREFESDPYSEYIHMDKFKDYKFCRYSVKIYNLKETDSILRETKYHPLNEKFVLIDDIRDSYSIRINLEKLNYTLKFLKKENNHWNLENLSSYPNYYPSLTLLSNWNINYNEIQYKPGAILIDNSSNLLFDTNTPEPCMF